MAVAHSAASESHTGTTGSTSQASFSWTHTQTDTPQGVLVFVHTISTSDFISSVTYGGVTLTRVTGAVAIDTAAEVGRTDLFFLGSGLGTGNQTITVNRTNNATVMYASAATVTAATNVLLAEIQVRQENQAPAEVSVTDYARGLTSLRYAAAYYGGASPPVPGANSTSLTSIDFGAFGCGMVRETTAGTGSRPVGFSDASDDYAGVFVAVTETKNFSTTTERGQFFLPERNLRRYSESFDNAAWTKSQASIIANAATAPDGTLTADALIENATPSVGHQVTQNITYITGRTYTASCYFELYPGPITRYARLQLGNAAVFGTSTHVDINLAAGTILSAAGSPSASGITNEGNGWYRAWLTKQYTGGGITSGPAIQIISTAQTALYTDADGLSGIYIWGAQFEEGPLSDYDPTGAASATPAVFKVASRIDGGTGSFALTGNPADTRHNVRIEASTRSFALTGNDATLTKLSAKQLSAEVGAFAFSGQAATFPRTWALQGSTGTFALTGNPASLTELGAYEINPSVGAFALTGQQATLAQSQTMPVDAGTFALNGQPASLRHGYALAAGTGAFTFTGNPATLDKQSARQLTADAGTFALTGNAATLSRGWLFSVDRGQFALTGQPATLAALRQLQAGVASFALTGNPAALQTTRLLTADAGTFALVGHSVNLTDTDELFVASGVFTLTGPAATFAKASTARRRNVLIF